jgi:hypothetical protein
MKICGIDKEGNKVTTKTHLMEGCGKSYEPNLGNARDNSFSIYCPECVKKEIDKYEEHHDQELKQHNSRSDFLVGSWEDLHRYRYKT